MTTTKKPSGHYVYGVDRGHGTVHLIDFDQAAQYPNPAPLCGSRGRAGLRHGDETLSGAQATCKRCRNLAGVSRAVAEDFERCRTHSDGPHDCTCHGRHALAICTHRPVCLACLAPTSRRDEHYVPAINDPSGLASPTSPWWSCTGGDATHVWFPPCGMPYVGPWHPDAVGATCALPIDHEGVHRQGSCYWENVGRGPVCTSSHENPLREECAVWWLRGTDKYKWFHPNHPEWRGR